VAEWKASMSAAEFECWAEFYRAHPFDDAHRYHRPAALLAARTGMRLEAAMDFLHPPQLPDGIDAAGLATMRALGIKPPE